MTREEIQKEIDQIEGRMFMLNMKDRWSNSDYETMRRWNQEKRELEAKMAVM